MRLSLVLIILFTSMCFGQDSTKIKTIELDFDDQHKMEFGGVFKSSLSVEGAGKSGFVGLSYDLLLSRHLRIGVGFGYPGAGADFKCYPFGVKRDKLLLNVGMRANALFPTSGTNYMFYSLPVGLSFFTVNRMNLELDAGPMLKRSLDQSQPETGIGSEIKYVWVSLKLGYRFSFYAMRRARKLDQLDQ